MQIKEISATKLPDIGIKRVAAYARVSSEKGEALHSLSAQISYYNEYISNHIGWEFAGVYADEGISGTKDSRPEFQRLLADCRKKRIDLVITKSITRFARNTVTLLDTIRELKLLNIDVLFEKENLHSLGANGDVISIIRKYLVSGIMIDDEYEDSVVGTPQGGNLSPLLANIMLNELDKEMEKRGLNFVRYADDCIIMVGSEMSANRVMRNISRFWILL